MRRTFHLTIAVEGKPPHYSEGFLTLEEAQRVAAECAECSPRSVVAIYPPATPYREELTPAGPQLVIPGCERSAHKPGSAQLDLFA